MYQSIPKPPISPRAIPGHLTRVKLRTVGNLTQNEARPVGHLTFMWKRLSAVGSKRISQFFDSAPRSRVIALVDSTWVFLLLSFYIVLSWNMPLFKVGSADKLNKKFVVAENFAQLASHAWRVGDLTLFEALTGGAFDRLNWQHSGEFDQKFSKKSNARGFARLGHGRFWNWPVHKVLFLWVFFWLQLHFWILRTVLPRDSKYKVSDQSWL